VVQCKRYTTRNIRPNEIILFVDAARRSAADRRYFFTTGGYANSARREARERNVTLFDTAAIKDWISDIRRRESGALHVPELPHPDQFPIPIIYVANHKGSVAKTTVTGNLAAALAEGQRGVLVIDADPQQHLPKWLTNQHIDFDPVMSLYEVLARGNPIHPLVRKTNEPNIWLLPASRQLETLPSTAGNGPSEFELERRLARAIAALPLLDPPIGYVLIDSPPALTFLTRSTTLAANQLLIPLQLDNLSYEGITSFLDFVERVEAQHGKHPTAVLGGVATLAERSLKLGQKFYKDIPRVATGHRRLVTAALRADRFWVGELRRRVDNPRAFDEHRTVLRLPGAGDAKRDTRALAKEVVRRAQLQHHPSR
jgi:chromosome partitioning protein